MNKVRILLADDHIMFRQGLERVINDTQDLCVSDTVGDGSEVLEKISHKEFDVLVLDIGMPGLSGFDVLKEIKRKKIDLKVLVLSMYPPEQYAIRALKTGAAGYLTKGSILSELISAIRQVASGKKFISEDVASLLSENILHGSNQAPHELLSEREYQVMCHLAKGETVSEIAKLLSLSSNTISTYRSRIIEKMHLRNNAEIAVYAVYHGLI